MKRGFKGTGNVLMWQLYRVNVAAHLSSRFHQHFCVPSGTFGPLHETNLPNMGEDKAARPVGYSQE
eukprot:747576-Hanusia_phi.AAC.2